MTGSAGSDGKMRTRSSTGNQEKGKEEESKTEGLSIQQQQDLLQNYERLQEENALLNAKMESILARLESANLLIFLRAGEQGSSSNFSTPSTSSSSSVPASNSTSSPSTLSFNQSVFLQPTPVGEGGKASNSSASPITNTVKSSTPLKVVAGGDLGVDDDLKGIIAEGHHLNRLVDSIRGPRGKKLSIVPASDPDLRAEVSKGKFPFEFHDSSSNDFGNDFDDAASNLVLAAMRSVVRAAKEKKMTKEFKLFEKLSTWFIKKVLTLPATQSRYLQLLKTVSQLCKEVGVATAWKYMRRFLKKDRFIQHRLENEENVNLLVVDSYDPVIFSTMVLPSIMHPTGPSSSSSSNRNRKKKESNGSSCWKYGSTSHFIRDCPKKAREKGKTSAQARQSSSSNNNNNNNNTNNRNIGTPRNKSRCSKCGGIGHAASVCPSA